MQYHVAASVKSTAPRRLLGADVATGAGSSVPVGRLREMRCRSQTSIRSFTPSGCPGGPARRRGSPLPDLMDRGRHGEPDQERDRDADDDEVKHSQRLRHAVRGSQPPGRHRRREGHGDQQEDDDAPHLPEPEDGCRHRDDGGGRLGDANGEQAVAPSFAPACSARARGAGPSRVSAWKTFIAISLS